TGSARRSNDGGITRGSSGGASILMLPLRVTGDGSRRRASKIKRLIGFALRLQRDRVASRGPDHRGRAAHQLATVLVQVRTTTGSTTESDSLAAPIRHTRQ